MLVLSRTQDESIVIDGRIKVTVIEVRRGVVRIGIDAPADINIRRAELAPRIRGAQEFTAEERRGALESAI